MCVRVFIQDKHGAPFKVDKINVDLQSKVLVWLLDLGFIDHLPWGLDKWLWKTMIHIGDTSFFR
jgi:hypothetical protein